jgi:hypothetical protein
MPLPDGGCEALAALARVERHLRQTAHWLTCATTEARFVSGLVHVVIDRFAAREHAPPRGAENQRERKKKDEAGNAIASEPPSARCKP